MVVSVVSSSVSERSRSRSSCQPRGSCKFSWFPCQVVLRTLFLFLFFPYNAFPSHLTVASHMFSFTITILYFYFWSFVLHRFVPFIFRLTLPLKAVHGSHQGSSSSCARWCDRCIMRRHCIVHCIAVHLFGIVWVSGLVYKDTMYRTFTPELFWSIPV